MRNGKRILAVIAIALCVMQILGLVVQVTRPEKEAHRPMWLSMANPREDEVARRTVVWYVGGLIFLGLAAIMGETHAWLQLSFGIAGVAALLVGSAGGGFSGRVFLWPRLILSFLTLAVLVLICLRLSRPASQATTSSSRQ